MNPLSTSRNDYYNNKKNSSIMTPLKVAEFIYSIVGDVLKDKTKYAMPAVLDPCCGTGNLLNPFHYNEWVTIGMDINKYTINFEMDEFIQSNFLSNFLKKIDIHDYDLDYDLIVCNPPFNNENEVNTTWLKEHKKGKSLLPEVFADKIFELFGYDIPLVLFTPMGMRLNQRKKSKRWKKMRDTWPEISSIVSLPLDIFPDVEFHNEILIFNIFGLKSHYFLHD